MAALLATFGDMNMTLSDWPTHIPSDNPGDTRVFNCEIIFTPADHSTDKLL